LLNDRINRRDRPIQPSDHRIRVSASEKNFGPPKFPDFSASSISPSLAPTALKTGTPAAIPAAARNAGMRKPVDDGAGRFVSGDYQPLHAGPHQAFRDIRHHLLDGIC
jgi:hypothetical protein